MSFGVSQYLFISACVRGTPRLRAEECSYLAGILFHKGQKMYVRSMRKIDFSGGELFHRDFLLRPFYNLPVFGRRIYTGEVSHHPVCLLTALEATASPGSVL